MVFARAFAHFMSLMLVIVTFSFAAKANVNQGVIGGLLAANIIYTSLAFYFAYKERISYATMVAMALIIAGVMCVSIKEESGDASMQVDHTYLLLSVLFAQLASFMFSMASLANKVGIKKYGLEPMKLVMDALLVSGIMQLPGLIYCYYWVVPYSIWGILEGMLGACFLTGGAVSVAKSMSVGGKGGPIQCLENMKIIIPLVLWSVIRGSLPTLLQLVGCALCLGATWIVGIYQ
jgi:drug/metabolite transporter (DMT)-like permease